MQQKVIKEELQRLAELATYYGVCEHKPPELFRRIQRDFDLLAAQTTVKAYRNLLEILWPQFAWCRPDLIVSCLFPVFATIIGDPEDNHGRTVPEIKFALLDEAA